MARVLIGVSGGIAAYKICEVVSTLAKAGVEVRVILTEQAQAFVSALTFATLARHSAYTDRLFWSAEQGRPLHIELGEWAEL
ncbi:MAG: flavoprotein, partial [Cyanobacteria bacterium P01_G01_bin.38]